MTARRGRTEKSSEREAWLEKVEFLSDSMESTSQPFGVGSVNGGLLLCNDAFCQLTGYSKEELLSGVDWSDDLTPPEWRQQEADRLREAGRTGKPRRYEKEYIRMDGSRVPVELLVHPAIDSAGNVLFYYTFITDITERRRVEEALRESEANYRQIVETANEGIWAIDAGGRTTYVNKRMADMLGYTPEEMIGRRSFDFMDEATMTESRQRLVQRSQGARDNPEVRYVRKDGSTVWTISSSTPVYDRDGRFAGALGMVTDITHRKQAEEALQGNENRFRTLIQNLKTGMALVDETGRFAVVNPAFLQMFGLDSESDILNVNSQDWSRWEVYGEDGELLRVDEHPVRKAALTGMPVRDQLVSVRCPGASERTWMMITAEPTRKEDGSVSMVICTYHDVTGSKQAERALRESEEKYRSLFENLSSAAVLAEPVLDADGGLHDLRYLMANPSAKKHLGKAPEELVGRLYSEVFPFTGRNPVFDTYEKVLSSGEPFRGEVLFPAINRYFDTAIFRPAPGRLALVLADITDRKKAEEEKEHLLADLQDKTRELELANEELEVKTEEMAAQAEELECANEEMRTNNEEMQRVTMSLHETQDYLESLINYANAPIIVWDPHFTITRFNRAFERLSGYMANEVLGENLSMLFPARSRDESLDRIKKTLEGEQWESVEIPIQHKYGSVRIALWNSANILGNDGGLLATIAQGQDITARKEAEKNMEEARAQAELYLDLMGHDISNMHQIIMMQLEIAREIIRTDGKLDETNGDVIDTAIRALEKAAKLIENVRKLRKLQAGDYRMEVVDLGATLEEVLRIYSDIPGRDIAVRYTPCQGCLMLANPLLKDVFGNLFDNALKHSAGPLEIGIDVHKVTSNGTVFYRVAIEDNGVGIPDERKDEVFRRFWRGQTQAKGTGLGLYLVKSLVEGFGGYVEVENRVLGDYTQGTRFLVYLPPVSEDRIAEDRPTP